MQQVVRFTKHPLSLALHLMLRGTKIALPVLLLSGQVAQVMAEPIASSHNDVINEQVEKSTLPTITVIANDDKSTSYITKKIAIGKTPQSLKETPQSVSVVTHQRLDDQNISTIDNAMKYVTGITVARYDAAGNYNDFYARGYGSDTYQMDGTTLRTDSNGTYLDLSVFD